MKAVRNGFTLFELLVVIFIISIVAALTFPSFSGIGESTMRSEAKRMASLLRYLNDGAIYSKQVFPLKFDLRDGAISWKGPDGEKSDRLKSLAAVTLSSKGEIREGEVTVFFGPLGTGENVEVLLRDSDGSTRIALNSTSGRVKVIDKSE